MRPTAESGVGERYRPVLASGRPELLPLGREFALARDAFWSDGTPVTSMDVRHTVDLLRKQGGLLESARLGEDPYHVRVMLTQGFHDPLAAMSFKVLPAALERLDDAKFAAQPLGSGPFMFQKRDKDQAIFAANPNYRREGKTGLPRIREVRFFHSKDPATDFRLQRLHVLLDPDAVTKVQGLDQVKTYALPNRRVYFLAVNHRRPALENSEVRLALAQAVNRTKILDEVFRAGWKGDEKPHRPLNSPYPAGCWACPEPAGDMYNLSAAKVHAKKAGSGKLTLKYPDGDARIAKACEQIRAQAVEAGLDVRLEPRTPAQLRTDVESDHDYDVAYYHFDFTSEAYLLWPLFDPKAAGRSGSNFMGCKPDAELQSYFHTALGRRDFTEVKRQTHAIHNVFQMQMPFIPLWQLDTLIGLHDSVRTFPEPRKLDPLAIFTDVERWEIK
jgi:ABC-type transport system substrate-binding protein